MSVAKAWMTTSDQTLLDIIAGPGVDWDAVQEICGEDEVAWEILVIRINSLTARHFPERMKDKSRQALVEEVDDDDEEYVPTMPLSEDENLWGEGSGEGESGSSSSDTRRSSDTSMSSSSYEPEAGEIPQIVVTHASPPPVYEPSIQDQITVTGNTNLQNTSPSANPFAASSTVSTTPQEPGFFSFTCAVPYNPFQGQAQPFNPFTQNNIQPHNPFVNGTTESPNPFTNNTRLHNPFINNGTQPSPNHDPQPSNPFETSIAQHANPFTNSNSHIQPTEQQPAEDLEASQLALGKFLNNPLNPQLVKNLHPKSLHRNPELKKWALLCEEVLTECSALYEAVNEPHWASLYRIKTEEFVRCRANGPLGSKFAFRQLVVQGQDAVAGRFREWIEEKMRVLKAEIWEQQRLKREAQMQFEAKQRLELEERQKQQNEALQSGVNTTWTWGQPATQPVFVNPPKLPTEMEGEYTGPSIVYLPTEMDIDPPEPQLMHPLQTQIHTGFGASLQGFGDQNTGVQNWTPTRQAAKNSGFKSSTQAMSPVMELDEPMSPPSHPHRAQKCSSNREKGTPAWCKDERWKNKKDSRHQKQPAVPTGPKADKRQSSHDHKNSSTKQKAAMTQEELTKKRREMQYQDRLRHRKVENRGGSDFSIKGAASGQPKGQHGKQHGGDKHHGRRAYHTQSGETSRNGAKGRFGRNGQE